VRGRGVGPRDRARKRGRSGDRGGSLGSRGAKMMRYDDRRRGPPPPIPKYRDRSPIDDYRYYDQQPTYEQYLRAINTRAPPPPRGVYGGPSHHQDYMYSDYAHNPPRYYDGTATMYSHRRSRSRSYDRSVEEFIRRTSTNRRSPQARGQRSPPPNRGQRSPPPARGQRMRRSRTRSRSPRSRSRSRSRGRRYKM